MSRSKKKPFSQPQKPQGTCLFCGGNGMTKQHIWPNWMNSTISKRANHNTQTTTDLRGIYHSRGAYNFLGSPNVKVQNGDIGTTKLRLICASCNNTWMSDIENAVKPVVVHLMNQDDIVVDLEKQSRLVAWISLMSIVAEFTDVPTKGISFEQRKFFMDNRMPSNDWAIWVGKYDGKEWAPRRYRHVGGAVHRVVGADEALNTAQLAQKSKAPRTTQVSTIVADKLIIVALSTSDTYLQEDFLDFNQDKLVKIWPTTQTEIDWSLLQYLSDEEAMACSNYITSFVKEHQAKILSRPL
jgi:hypothetical protein